MNSQQKLELHRAKRRAQAAARKERKRKEDEAKAHAASLKKKAEGSSRAPSFEIEQIMTFDDVPVSSSGLPTLESFPMSVDTPDPDDHSFSRPFSPVPTVGSVSDVQAYFTEAVHDTSEYNTEYEDPEHDGSSRGGDIDDEIARLAA